MEKLLEFRKGKLFGQDSKYYRFQCDCLSAADAMDVCVESTGKDNEDKFFIITMNFLGTGFWNRMKYAFQILKGHWAWREFVVRQEDTQDLSDIFNPGKKYSELP